MKRLAGHRFPSFRRYSLRFFVIGLIPLFLLACTPLAAQRPLAKGQATARAVDQGLLSSVLANGRLVIATDPSYPPQSQLNQQTPRLEKTNCDTAQYTANQLEGFDIDVASEIARRIGVEPCFVTPAWSQLVSGGWSNRWDISVGSMVITSERMQTLYFTQPYISGAAVLFVHKDNQTLQSPEDFSGKRIGVCTGCAYEGYLNSSLQIPGIQISFQIHEADIVGYDTDTSALADLARGDGSQLDAVLTDPDTGNALIKQGLPIRQVGEPVYHDFSAIAIDKKSSSDPLPLVLRITEIVQAMHQDGTLLKLSQQYYHDDFTSPAAAFDFSALEQLP